jgi:hypothetical protein
VVRGYRSDPSADPHPAGVRPIFNVRPVTKGGDIEFLQQNVASISKVICKTVLTTMEPGQRSWLQSMLDITRIAKSPPPNVVDAPIRVEFPISLTLEELNASINEWAEDISDSGENDLGFRLNDGKMKWLRKSNARQTQRLDVVWVDDELVDLTVLLRQLQVHRSTVLAMR